MKKDIEIQVLKKEDIAAASRRRENYALTRDQQAIEFNEAISKRLLSEATIQAKCQKCGREFTVVSEGSLTCPECN